MQNYGAPQNSGMPPVPPVQMMPQPAPAPRRTQDNRPTNGLAVAGLSLGIIGFVFSLIPFFGTIGLILGIVGLTLSIIAIVQTGPARPTRGRGMAITGTILSALAVIATVIMFIFAFILLVDPLRFADNDYMDDSDSQTQSDDDVRSADDTDHTDALDRIIQQTIESRDSTKF